MNSQTHKMTVMYQNLLCLTILKLNKTISKSKICIGNFLSLDSAHSITFSFPPCQINISSILLLTYIFHKVSVYIPYKILFKTESYISVNIFNISPTTFRSSFWGSGRVKSVCILLEIFSSICL